MGASLAGGGGGGSRRGGRRAKRAPMAEINVTPFVDVMLVLLIIFMVTAPLLAVGVPLELPKTQAKEVRVDAEPLTITLATGDAIFLQESRIELDDLAPRLQAIASAGNKASDTIFIRADASLDYGRVMQVIGRVNAAGFEKFSLITDVEG